MLAGKEEFLMARDRGDERRLVRDIVDSRRNMASYFLPGALIVVIGSARSMPGYVQLGGEHVLGDARGRGGRGQLHPDPQGERLLSDRFPKSTKPRAVALLVRHHAQPQLPSPAHAGPQVKLGDPI